MELPDIPNTTVPMRPRRLLLCYLDRFIEVLSFHEINNVQEPVLRGYDSFNQGNTLTFGLTL